MNSNIFFRNKFMRFTDAKDIDGDVTNKDYVLGPGQLTTDIDKLTLHLQTTLNQHELLKQTQYYQNNQVPKSSVHLINLA